MTAARWPLVAFVGALAAILIFSALATWLTARRAYDTLLEGQASALLHAVRRELPREGRLDDALAQVLAEQRDAGLRHVEIVDGHHVVVASVGASVFGDTPPGPPPPGRAVEEHGVVRAAAPAGGPGGPPPPPGKGLGPPPRAGRPGGPPPHPPWLLIVVEFEPAIGTALRTQADRSLAIGIAGALGLVLVAWVFFASTRRALAAEARLVDQQHLATLGEMSAVLAHELRNPLASLRGHAQLLEELLGESSEDPRAQDKARRVIAETTRLQRIIDGLLDFARSGNITRSPVDPEAVAREAIADVDPERIDLVVDRAPSSWSLDAARMRQVLVNLLTNAIQASPADARVELRVGMRRDALVFAVRDEGAGVPAEARERLFAAFHTTKTRGVGLGLAVARRITELHGGRIALVDGTAGPTVFEVTIPAPP